MGASNRQTPHGRDGANVQTRRKYSKTLQIQYVMNAGAVQAIPLIGRSGVESQAPHTGYWLPSPAKFPKTMAKVPSSRPPSSTPHARIRRAASDFSGHEAYRNWDIQGRNEDEYLDGHTPLRPKTWFRNCKEPGTGQIVLDPRLACFRKCMQNKLAGQLPGSPTSSLNFAASGAKLYYGSPSAN